ncbi:MAG: bifunctional [glutamate--ammonia ligase]-adenylyl-L-tyrosine phosphorylase/[glutamate--ammonia-ligase] adenylyltransferase, partial [Glaciecola sp.]|nr:bifunctional [glutamate--ammonia ligase]-adenylyl-L-tyrosine phosphorylase/[glutamate--ammonia-ligase] adenylyltransferase [Glaciecola sp.]
MNLDNLLLASPEANFTATFTAQLQQVINISRFAEETFMQYPWMLGVIDELQTTHASLDSIDVLQVTQTHLGYAELATLSELQQLSLLRVSRHLGMVMFLWRDVLNQQSIETSLELVSRLADTLIMQAYDFAYTGFEQRYGTPTDEHGRQELYILGMGKLGGKELNFSSDIDLIVTYPQVGEFSERRNPFEYQQFFIKVAQKLIHLLNTQTTDGQVYRVDMRLRPFGESGPLVLPFSAMENYYESQGRSWERFAMLKSRIINPVPAPQDPNKLALANIIRPFIYRRYVDFSIIESLRDLKQKIVQEVRRRQLHHNIKLGAGGIREVEFLVQSFQLIYAGRIPALKTASIFSALAVIEQEALLPHDIVQSITHCYLILRKAEHTLQQFNNAQTQTLPDTPSGQDTLGAIMYGYFADHPELNNYCSPEKGIMHGIEQVQGVIHQHFSVFIQDETQDSTQQDLHDWSHDIWQEISHDPSYLPNVEFVCQQLRQSASPIASELVEPILQQLQQLATALNKAQIGDRGEAILIKLVPVFLKE